MYSGLADGRIVKFVRTEGSGTSAFVMEEQSGLPEPYPNIVMRPGGQVSKTGFSLKYLYYFFRYMADRLATQPITYHGFALTSS